MITLRLNRRGKNFTAYLGINGAFALAAVMIGLMAMTGDGRELLIGLVKLAVSAAR